MIQKDVFDGIMISDGHIQHQRLDSYFSMSQGGILHVDWLYDIKLAFIDGGIEVSNIWPKTIITHIKGKLYRYSRFETAHSEELEEQRLRWYNGKLKIVPEDIVITPIMLANWFMGDGTSSFEYRALGSVNVSFCTDNFTENEVLFLIDKLKVFGLEDAHISSKPKIVGTGMYYEIKIGQSSCVDNLMDIIEPYMCESYKYKIKHTKFNVITEEHMVLSDIRELLNWR